MQSFLILIYTISIRVYGFVITLASFWNSKASQWVNGRKHLFEELASRIDEHDRMIWIHCASAGEFEQGKPVIESLREQYPKHKILISFFSPSGYAAGQKYGQADIICYVPLDTPANAKKFIRIVRPELVVFIKYEYWYHLLSAAAFRHIPILLVAAIFRKNSIFFSSYGKLHRQMLFLFRHIFVQDEASSVLLNEIGVNHVIVGGDTRFDRVVKIADQFTALKGIEKFTRGQPVIVAGSTWPDDEKLLAEYVSKRNVRLILAPHEIHPSHLGMIRKWFPKALFYSQIKNMIGAPAQPNEKLWDMITHQASADLNKILEEAKVLVVDNFGMLSGLYHYATVTYIGGGFNKSGIHNTLEAAVWSKPVLFGPNYQKFREARELIAVGGGFSIQNKEELELLLDDLLNNPAVCKESGLSAGHYVASQTGATEKLMRYIQEKRLLTS